MVTKAIYLEKRPSLKGERHMFHHSLYLRSFVACVALGVSFTMFKIPPKKDVRQAVLDATSCETGLLTGQNPW